MAFLLLQVLLLALTANRFSGLCGIAIIVSIFAIRVPEEERILIGQDGDECRNYIIHTGSLLPKFSS